MRLITSNKNQVRDYLNIVKKKKLVSRIPLQNERWNIPYRFTEYHEKAKLYDLESISVSRYTSDPIHSSLLSCYNRSKGIDKIKNEIINSRPLETQDLCPYCYISEYSSFDHYLPKEKFAEFSVFGNNLVPCCSKCNSIKGEDWKDSLGRVFIQFYYDGFIDQRFLNCSIELNQGIPKAIFSIVKPSSMLDSELRVIQEHFARLNLLERYQRLSNSDISEVKIQFEKNYKAANRNKIAPFILNEVSGLKQVFGVNFRKAVLKEALANSSSFISSLKLAN